MVHGNGENPPPQVLYSPPLPSPNHTGVPLDSPQTGAGSHGRMKSSLSQRRPKAHSQSVTLPGAAAQTPSGSAGCAGGFVRSGFASRGSVTRRWDYGAGELNRKKIKKIKNEPRCETRRRGGTKEREGAWGPHGGMVAFRGVPPLCLLLNLSSEKESKRREKLQRS